MTSHDWMVLLSQAGTYVMKDAFVHEKRNRAVLALLNATTALVQVDSPHDVNNSDILREVKAQLIEAACLMESVLPKTELAPLFHILIHVPDMIYRWNNIRNFWCFFGERYVWVSLDTCVYL
jgi:hypothetical protein